MNRSESGAQDRPYDDEELRDIQDERQEHDQQMMIIRQELGDSPVSNPVKGGESGRQALMGRGARRMLDGGEGGGMMHESD